MAYIPAFDQDQSDYILVRERYRNSVKNTHSYPGSQCWHGSQPGDAVCLPVTEEHAEEENGKTLG